MDESNWRFVGYTMGADGTTWVRLYAHIAYASCCAVVAEEDRLDHEQWHERLTEEIYREPAE